MSDDPNNCIPNTTADADAGHIINNNNRSSSSNNDLILDEGFPALNTFHLPKSASTEPTQENPPTLPVLAPAPPIPRYPFASFPSALIVANPSNREATPSEITNYLPQCIYHDCELAFTARTKDESSAYSSGSTFFIPASMKPRCALECLAMDIFQSHTKGLEPGRDYDIERSGAEWWTLVLDVSTVKKSKYLNASSHPDDEDHNESECEDDDGNDEEEEDDEVGMHFDADYGLESQLPHYMIHPRIATVTYLSNVGVPTLVLNRKSPPPSDIEKKTLGGNVDRGWLSYPVMGKHIAFDGRLMHGAPGTFFPSMMMDDTSQDDDDDVDSKDHARDAKRRKMNHHDGEERDDSDASLERSNKRITFLVNIWLNHCPMDAELLDDDLCEQMKTPWNRKNASTTAVDSTSPSTSAILVWNLQDVNQPPELPKGVIQPRPQSKGGKDVGKNGAGTDECVICGREVDIHYKCEMKDLHKISLDAYKSEGKSMQLEFKEDSIGIVVGDQVQDSDSDEQDNDDGDNEDE